MPIVPDELPTSDRGEAPRSGSLGDFIRANLEPILQVWEDFARELDASGDMDPVALRDHARAMLLAIARDMGTHQSEGQSSSKSRGERDETSGSARMGDASRAHGEERVDTGFGLLDMVSEYRALRASVLRLWSQDGSAYSAADVRDMVRFNEAIDQSLAIATQAYTESVERSREMFQAMLWHDLRNPLNAVRMAASLLDEEAPLGEDDRRLVTQIRASSEAMNQLISDLIDLSSGKIRAGIPVFPADMDLGELCQQVAAETRASSPDRPVTVRTDGDLRGRWDAGRLRQVLSNLLGNAVHHGEGPIDLWATGSAPAGVELGVRNGGPPIPKEILPRLFDPMARSRSGQNRRPGSLGLGLHIVSEIVSGHGGSVEVESSPETGTVVMVRLPRSAPAPDAA